MRLMLPKAEMRIYCALECGIQLIVAVERRSGLNVLSLIVEPKARMAVVHLCAAARNDADTFLSFDSYPQEDQQPADRFPVAGERADGRAFIVHHLFIQEIIQDSDEVGHSPVRQRVHAAAGILIDGFLWLRKWIRSVHELFALSISPGFNAGC